MTTTSSTAFARANTSPRFTAELDALLDPATFIGRAPEQVEGFLASEVKPALAPWQSALEGESELRV